MRDVAVIGIGMNAFGELWDKSLRDVFVESAVKAIDDAGVDHIDSMVVGCMSSGLFVGQEHIGALLADYLGVTPIPAIRIESACASGGAAFRQAFIEVASGISDIVLAGGVEKMTDVGGDEATYALGTAADQEYEGFSGMTFPGLYAMMATHHMHNFGTTREQMAAVAVKNHYHGSLNENAQFPMEVSIEQVLNSVMVADPLRILDCSPITDGAAAVILCPAEMAKTRDNRLVRVIGTGQATDTIALHDRAHLSRLDATARAAAMAYKMAGKTPSEMDFAEVHDCFTIAEICITEALGFAETGKGGPLVESGSTRLDGKIPVNTSGGLKSKGHPVGATGIAQIVEVVEQLRGGCGKRQVKNANIGLAQNMGGSGASAVVHIMEGA